MIRKIIFLFSVLIGGTGFALAQSAKVLLSSSVDEVILRITPRSSLYHEALVIEASGLPVGKKVKLELSVLDARGIHWSSGATFISDADGKVDPTESASVAGSYLGVQPMGLFWSLKSLDYHQITTSTGYSAVLTVSHNDVELARDSIYRKSTRELKSLGIALTAKRDSFIADYYQPKGTAKLPAVIYLGGSGGGFRQERSSLLASEGIAVLNLKYFRFEGLPDGIVEIPLEYVARAHDWLKARPEVDPNRIGIIGRSRGSELALLYAAHFKELRYVIAEAPSNVTWFGWAENKSSWSYRGKPFPYAEYSDEASVRIEEEFTKNNIQYRDGPKFASAFSNEEMIYKAEIPVESISCPILLVSGKDDQTWPAEMMADRMVDRLIAKGFNYEFLHLSYESAGHNFAGGGQGCGIPFLPPEDYSGGSAKGGTDQGNALAAERSWTEELRFIERHSGK